MRSTRQKISAEEGLKFSNSAYADVQILLLQSRRDASSSVMVVHYRITILIAF